MASIIDQEQLYRRNYKRSGRFRAGTKPLAADHLVQERYRIRAR